MKNKTIVSAYHANAFCVTFEGDKEYIKRGFNFMNSFVEGSRENTYFNFKYCTTGKDSLKKGYELLGRTIKLQELWREQAKKKSTQETSEEEEKEMELEAKAYGEKFAEEEMSKFEYKNFLYEIQADSKKSPQMESNLM